MECGLDIRQWVIMRIIKYILLVATGILRMREEHMQNELCWNEKANTYTPVQSRSGLLRWTVCHGKAEGVCRSQVLQACPGDCFPAARRKKHKEKPTSESNTERRPSRGVEAMPELVFHIRKPWQMYWNVALSSAWQKVAGLTRQENWGDQFGAILFQGQKLKCKPLFRVEGRTRVSLLTEKDLSLGGS